MIVEGEKIIVGEGSERRSTKKYGLIALCVVVGLLAVGTGIFIAVHGHKAANAPGTASNTSDTSNDSQPLTPDEQNSQELAQAQQVIENDKKGGVSSQDQALHYADLGNAYLNNGDPKSAVDAFKKEAEADASFKAGSWSGLMQAYSDLGQFSDALTAANQLLAYYQSSSYKDELKDDNISVLKGQIAQLQAGEKI